MSYVPSDALAPGIVMDKIGRDDFAPFVGEGACIRVGASVRAGRGPTQYGDSNTDLISGENDVWRKSNDT